MSGHRDFFGLIGRDRPEAAADLFFLLFLRTADDVRQKPLLVTANFLSRLGSPQSTLFALEKVSRSIPDLRTASC